MHHYGKPGVDWQSIHEAAEYIAEYLHRYGGITVLDHKEKFGTVRVYCTFGYHWMPSLLNDWIVIPYQEWIYRKAHRNALRKYSNIREEILSGASYWELLEDL
jgi:hypothetical protein